MTTEFFPDVLNAYPVTAPYVAAIPSTFRQGDSGTWVDLPLTDVNGVEYDSSLYSLRYVFAGPSAPLVLTATTDGNSWQTNITTVQSAALTPGLYWWELQVLATGIRVTLAAGEITITPDLALQVAGYDQRTTAEKALADAEAALSVFQASGGRIQSYTIGMRHMAFQKDSDILAIVNYWRNRVLIEQAKAQGSRSRMILTRFQRAR